MLRIAPDAALTKAGRDGATRWRAPRADALRIVTMDVLTAIHHRSSGMTHLVDSPVPEILAAIGPDWTTEAILLDRLIARYDIPDPDPAALAGRLSELAEAGLIERG